MISFNDSNAWMILSYCVCVGIQVIMAAVGIVYTKVYSSNLFKLKSHGKNEADLVTPEGSMTAKGFLTARQTQGGWRIAWSFFATAMGARAVIFPSYYASKAGWLGLMFYSLSCGVPIMVISFIGPSLQYRCPKACSLGDFVLYRFGHCARFFVSCIVIFNMGLAMLAEYMVVGSLFKNFVGNYTYPIISTVAFLTAIYTIYGGLPACIVAHQPQALLSLVLIVIISIYVAVTFRQNLAPDFGDQNYLLAPNYMSFSSIYVWPCSLMATTVFSDAIWQRVWAAESASALRFGGFVGGITIIISVYLLGFAGFLASWAGLTNAATTDKDLYLIQVFVGTPSQNWDNGQNTANWGPTYVGPTTISNWMSVLILILAIVLNQAYVSSIKCGVAGTIGSFFMGGKPIFTSLNGTHWARLSILVISAPILVIAYLAYEIGYIILISNLLCSCCFIPVLLGFWDSAYGRTLITESGVIFSFISAILTVSAYVIGRYTWNGDDAATSIHSGFQKAWKDNLYLTDYSKYIPQNAYPSQSWATSAAHPWDIYIVASGSSVVALLLFMAVSAGLRRCGFEGMGISRIICCCCPAQSFDEDVLPEEGIEQDKGKDLGSISSQCAAELKELEVEHHRDSDTPRPAPQMPDVVEQKPHIPELPPASGIKDHQIPSVSAPYMQSVARAPVPASQPASWTPALPWTPMEPRPQAPTMRTSVEAIHGSHQNYSFGEEYPSGANSSYHSFSHDGPYRAYHPASITLDVEGDIGDA